ncbi:MAG TPA: hypothetical protein VIJ42_17025 [Stellaceae bacterium]
MTPPVARIVPTQTAPSREKRRAITAASASDAARLATIRAPGRRHATKMATPSSRDTRASQTVPNLVSRNTVPSVPSVSAAPMPSPLMAPASSASQTASAASTTATNPQTTRRPSGAGNNSA